MTAACTRDELKALLANRSIRNRLVMHVLPVNGDLASKVRFCASVDEFTLTKDKVDKKQRGRKIVCTFVESGSLFGIKNIPGDLARELTSSSGDSSCKHLDKLLVLQDLVFQELCSAQLVGDFVETVREDLSPQAAVPQAQGKLKRVPSKLEVWSNEFYDTVISPVLSPMLRLSFPAPGPATMRKVELDAMALLTEEGKELQAVLEDKTSAHRMILKLAAGPQLELSVKARLCCSVLDYEKISDKRFAVEKKAKGRKIVSTFVQSGSLFCVKDLPKELVCGLTASSPLGEEKLELLQDVKLYLYGELLKDQTVRNEIRDILNQV
ncbi:hypothetical protein BASA81_005817 [Batrachochytrium salamandrivorans]|nr:hypothetical protein BASA81_005817 [Batrachochytrium salamandrivorans]